MTELGNRLREAREEKGLTLDELQQITKIQKRYLRGIEEGDYSSLPGQFYVRAFIKQYAEAVGLDHEQILEQYKSDLPQLEVEQIRELAGSQSRKTRTDSAKLFNVFPKVLIAVFIIGALLLAYYLWSSRSADNPNENISLDNSDNTPIILEEQNTPKEEPIVEDEEVIEDDKAEDEDEVEDDNNRQNLQFIESSGRKTTYELTNSEEFVVKVVSSGQSWVEIKNGKGHKFYAGMLTSQLADGETVDLSKESEAVIVIGRATEADIYINDEKLTYEIDPAKEVRQDIIIKYVKE